MTDAASRGRRRRRHGASATTFFDATRGCDEVRPADLRVRAGPVGASGADAGRGRDALRPGRARRGRRSAARSPDLAAGASRLRRARHAVARRRRDDGLERPLGARPRPRAGARGRRTRSSTSRTGSAAARRRRGSSGCSASTRGRLHVRDAVRRLHPARPRARPLPPATTRCVYVLEGEGALHIDGESGPLAPGLVRPPAGAARPLPREHRRRGDGGARRLPPGRLARRGLLPRRHGRRRTATEEELTCRRIERIAEVVWEGNLARGVGSISGRHRRLHRPAVLARRRGSSGPRARRAPRSCSRRRTAAASRCRSRAS